MKPPRVALAVVAATVALSLPSASAQQGRSRTERTERWAVSSTVTELDLPAIVATLEAQDHQIARCVAESPSGSRSRERRAHLFVGPQVDWAATTPNALDLCVAAALVEGNAPRPVMASGHLRVEIPEVSSASRVLRTEYGGDTPLRLEGTASVPFWLRASPEDEPPAFWSRRPWRQLHLNETTELALGRYEVGIGTLGRIRPLEQTVTLDAPTVMEVTFDDRRGWRDLGWVLAGVGIAAVVVALVMLLPFGIDVDLPGAGGPSDASAPDDYLAAVGAVGLPGVVLLAVGAPLTQFNDGAATLRPAP